MVTVADAGRTGTSITCGPAWIRDGVFHFGGETGTWDPRGWETTLPTSTRGAGGEDGDREVTGGRACGGAGGGGAERADAAEGALVLVTAVRVVPEDTPSGPSASKL